MTIFVDKNANVIDTTGSTVPEINAAVNGFVDPSGAPNINTASSYKTTPTSLNITNGSGQVIAQWANPA